MAEILNVVAGNNNGMMLRMQQMKMQASGSIIANPQLAPPDAPSFQSVLKQAINKVDQYQHSANNKQRAIEMGESDDLNGAIIGMQEASVTFSAMVQVRNKLAQAFDDVLNMPL